METIQAIESPTPGSEEHVCPLNPVSEDFIHRTLFALSKKGEDIPSAINALNAMIQFATPDMENSHDFDTVLCVWADVRSALFGDNA
jgi:hypothetical protein